MKIYYRIIVAIMLFLLLLMFVVLSVGLVTASWQLMNNTGLAIKEADSAQTFKEEGALKLQMEAYAIIFKDVLFPLLSALVAGFIAFVSGKTIGTVSYNRAQEKKGTASNPKQLELW